MKRILISAENGQTRVAVLEADRLVELHAETGETESLVGNIYRARVDNVLSGMQAAFVDIGQKKNAFLYIDDALPPAFHKTRGGREKPNIRELVHNGQELLVEVTKEAFGSKAPRVTTQISLTGRMLVYMPYGGQVSVSRRILDERERKRLEAVARELIDESEGVILRTMAEGADRERLAAELAYLREVWADALAQGKEKKPPCLVYRDADLPVRVVRDLFADDVDELIVDRLAVLERVKQTVRAFHPERADRVRFYQGKTPLFAAYGVDAEIDKALKRHVPLKSGGFLVIDQTEAMTVIDVNTGRFTGAGGQRLEETVTRANLEAAEEIARQLRLRDIGGIVIIDFIDMNSQASRERVLAALQAALARDRTTTVVLGITRLGLVEMTRKKIRQNLSDALTRPCPVCDGRGRVLSGAEALFRLEQEVRASVRQREIEAVVVEAASDLAALLAEGGEAARLAGELGIAVHVVAREGMTPGRYRIAYAGSAGEGERRAAALRGQLLGPDGDSKDGH